MCGIPQIIGFKEQNTFKIHQFLTLFSATKKLHFFNLNTTIEPLEKKRGHKIKQKGGFFMAIIHASFFSNQLKRTVPFTAVIPNDGAIFPGQEPSFATGEMKTVYMLHGYMGDENDWLINTNIRLLSEKYKLAVIMPAGENSFYIDDPEGVNCFGRYIGEELVEYTRKLFHLSRKREDTFIAGLSMGGYGAMRNGLKYAQTFSKICAFSGCYIVYRIINNGGKPFADDVSGPDFQRKTFGDLTKLDGSDMDPRHLYLELKKNGQPIPEIFMTEGSEDFLLDVNHIMRDFLAQEKAKFTYIEDTGVHDWVFWNKHLEEAIEFLLDESKEHI